MPAAAVISAAEGPEPVSRKAEALLTSRSWRPKG